MKKILTIIALIIGFVRSGQTNNTLPQLKPSEITCVTDTLYREAGNEPISGQMAVVHIIMNRSYDRKKSLCSITSEKGQFSTVRLTKVNDLAYNRCRQIAKNVLLDPLKFPDNTHHSLYFHADYISFPSTWNRKIVIKIHIGHHIFYGNRV